MGNAPTHIENFVPALFCSSLGTGKKTYFLLFALFFLLNFGEYEMAGQNPSSTVPSYVWQDESDMGSAEISTLKNIVISIDTDSKGNVYALTFGNGIEKFNAAGVSQGIIINGGSLNDPLDMVIDNNDIIYIADSESKLIRKFDVNGNSKGSIGSGYGGGGKDEFWEPTGLAIDDQNNLYIVDVYRGDNKLVVERYFLKIYYANGTFESFQGTDNHPLLNPYRVGVDSKGNIYISHAAHNGEVLVFNADLNYLETLSNIGSPGSIVVDKYDFVHIVDYADKFDLNRILNKDVGYLILALGEIKKGIDNENFGIQIYDSDMTYRKFINKNLDLPLDIALFECEKMYVNDSRITGSNIFSTTLHFQLDIYNRTSACGKDENLPPIFDNCPQKKIVKETDLGNCGAIVTFERPTATNDGESISVTRIDNGPESGELFPVGTTRVTFEADDGINPPVECSFKVIVEDHEDPVINCPKKVITKTISANQDAVVVEFKEPEFSDNCLATIKQTKGLPSGSEFPVGTTTIEFTATDASGNQKPCSFDIIISREDSIAPAEFENCPENIPVNTDPGKCGAMVAFETPIAFQGNKPLQVVQTEGLTSGKFFPIGKTTITFKTTGAENNIECSFPVVVTDNEVPQINCPVNQTRNFNPETGFSIPDFTSLALITDNCGIDNIVQSPPKGTLVYEQTEITLTVTDEAGNPNDCSFTLFLTENEALEIFCPENQTGSLNENCRFTVPDYRQMADVNNENASLVQTPKPGETITGDTKIQITATLGDKTATCDFQLELVDTIAPTAICASEITLQLNINGIATLTAEEVNKGSRDNCGLADIEIDKSTFTGNNLGQNTVILTVTDAAGNKDSCKTMVFIEPYENNSEFQCRDSITLELNENGEAKLNARELINGNIQNLSYSVDKEDFTCADLGQNTVTLSYSGPEKQGSCEIEVIVTDPDGHCTVAPVEPPFSGTFLIVYPNPGRGMVNILTSSDILLEKVEVFDMKTQLLFEREFTEPANRIYKVDLRNVQSGVYLLKLYGDDQIYYERVIILRI